MIELPTAPYQTGHGSFILWFVTRCAEEQIEPPGFFNSIVCLKVTPKSDRQVESEANFKLSIPGPSMGAIQTFESVSAS
jgi:hypothetical protein